MAKKTIQNESRTPRKRADNAEQMPVAELGPVKTLPVGTKLECHQLSTMYPSMPDDQADGLENSLRTKGQINPIVLYKGKVIDGRERYLKLSKLGMSIKVIDYTGDDPTGYVWALNSCRKSLTRNQRLLVVTRMVTLRPGQKTKETDKETNLSLSLKDAATLVGESESTIKSVKAILGARDNILLAGFESGKLSVNLARELIGKDEDVIQEVLNSDNPKQTAAELLPERGKSNGGKSSKKKPSFVDDSVDDDGDDDTVARSQRTAVQANKSSGREENPDSDPVGRLFGRVLKDYEKLEPEQKEVFRNLILGLVGANTPSSDQDDGDQDENDEGDDVRLLMETLDDDDESDLDDQEEEYDDDEDSEEQDDVGDENDRPRRKSSSSRYSSRDSYDEQYEDDEEDEHDDEDPEEQDDDYEYEEPRRKSSSSRQSGRNSYDDQYEDDAEDEYDDDEDFEEQEDVGEDDGLYDDEDD